MESDETPEVSQASGTSIFWALVALALNAMTETSRTGSLLSTLESGPGTATPSNTDFDPLRSSPVFCAAEIIFDILFFIVDPKPQESLPGADDVPNAPNTTAYEPPLVAEGQKQDVLPDPDDVATTSHSKPTTDNSSSTRTTLKVIAFLLGVLPQAIKLFSMSGVAGTQTCAAIFLTASVVRAVSYKSSSHFAMSVDALRSGTYRAPGMSLLLFTFIAQCVLYVWLYFNIAGGLFFEDAGVRASASGYPASNISFELAATARSAYLIFGMLTILSNIVHGRSLTTSQWLPLLMLIGLQERDPPAQFAESGTWIVPPPLWLRNLSRGLALITMSLVGCLQVSALCIAIGRVVSRLAAERAARSNGQSEGDRQPTSADAGDPGLLDRFHHIIGTVWRGMVWLKDVFVDIRGELDNEEEWVGTWHEGFGATIEQIGLAWGIFNLLTALLYHLVVFDSSGTSSPSWTSCYRMTATNSKLMLKQLTILITHLLQETANTTCLA